MNLDGGSKKSDIDYLFYFETKWDCAKYVKLMNILQNADMSNDTPLL
jgi:predicted nucleotidyltransferase